MGDSSWTAKFRLNESKAVHNAPGSDAVRASQPERSNEQPEDKPRKNIRQTLGQHLAAQGYNFRQIRKLLKGGRIEVNGKIERSISRMIAGDFVVGISATGASIRESCTSDKLPTILVFHKPCDVVTTFKDEFGRKSVKSYFSKELLDLGLHPIGRLDQHSTGLLLFTTDGKLTRRLTDPSNHIPREYSCIVVGKVNFTILKDRLAKGVNTRFGTLKGEVLSSRTLVNENEFKDPSGDQVKKHCLNFSHRSCGKQFTRQDGPRPLTEVDIEKTSISEVRIRVAEGKKRMVRRMLAHCGHPVLNLFRYKFGMVEIQPEAYVQKTKEKSNVEPRDEASSLVKGTYRLLNEKEKKWLVSVVLK